MNHKQITSPLVIKFLFASILFSFLGLYMSISLIGLGHILLLIPMLFLVRKKDLASILEYNPAKYLLGFILVGALSVIFNWGILENPWKNLLKLKYFIISLLSIPCYEYFIELKSKEKLSSLRLLVRILLISATVASCSGMIGLFSGFNPLTLSKACDPDQNCGLSGMLMTYAYSISIFCSILMGWLINFKENPFLTKIRSKC